MPQRLMPRLSSSAAGQPERREKLQPPFWKERKRPAPKEQTCEHDCEGRQAKIWQLQAATPGKHTSCWPDARTIKDKGQPRGASLGHKRWPGNLDSRRTGVRVDTESPNILVQTLG
jgi:hypothetical protein